MSNTIEIDGLEDFTKMLEGMTLSPAEETKAMRNALEVPYKTVVDNAPVKTGVTKKSIKKTIRKDGFATEGIIRVNSWIAVFTEFGTSKSKSHVGWFSNPIEKTNKQFLKTLSNELFSKAK